MPKKITKLTAEQEARMPEWRDRWIAHGLSTERADWGRFERGIRAAYRFAKLEQPMTIVRVPSPLVLAFAAPIADHVIRQLCKTKSGGAVRVAVRGAVDDAVRGAVDDAVDVAVRGAVDDAVRDAVRGAVDDAVRGAVDDAVDDAVDVAVRVAVRDAVGGAVGGAVDDAVDGAVDDAVGDAVGGAVGGAVKNNWTNYLGGQFWVGGWWGSSSFVSFFRDVCGLTFDDDTWERAKAYEDMSYAGWCWPHTKFCMVSDRPTLLHRDEEGRLHCEDGPAIAWSDGFCIHRIHGVTVPQWIIERPDTITIEAIDKEDNAEVKRIMMERMGISRYLQESGATVVAMDMVKPHHQKDDYMPRALMRDKSGRQFMVGTDASTVRVYYMQTSNTAKTISEAHEAINGGLLDSLCIMRS